MNPNDVPERVIELINVIADNPHLKNYQALKKSFGATCPITKKAAEIFMSEHIKELVALERIIDEFELSQKVHGSTESNPT